MKRRLLLFALAIAGMHYSAQSQGIIPIQKGQTSATLGSVVNAATHNEVVYDSVRNALRVSEVSSTGGGSSKPYKAMNLAERKSIDKGVAADLKDFKAQRTSDLVDTLNKHTPRVHILSSGGIIGSMDEVKDAFGSFSIGLQYRLTSFRQIGNNWIDPHYIYAMFNMTTARSADSNALLKTLLFPELSKRDFVLGYYWQISKDGYSFEPTFEVSLNKYADSSSKKLFRSESFLIGAKASKSFLLPKLNVQSAFQFFLYYNLINIDPKYNDGYRSITGQPFLYNTFHCIGLQTQIQIDRMAIFCNGKYILNKDKAVTAPDLIRFVYTIGTLVTL